MSNLDSYYSVIAYYDALWKYHDKDRIAECLSDDYIIESKVLDEANKNFTFENKQDALDGIYYKWFDFAKGAETKIKKFEITMINESDTNCTYVVNCNFEQSHKNDSDEWESFEFHTVNTMITAKGKDDKWKIKHNKYIRTLLCVTYML